MKGLGLRIVALVIFICVALLLVYSGSQKFESINEARETCNSEGLAYEGRDWRDGMAYAVCCNTTDGILECRWLLIGEAGE